MMLWLDEEDAPKTTEDYDRFTCAEFPAPGEAGSKQRELHDLVSSLMVHGPCVGVNEESPCYNNQTKLVKKVSQRSSTNSAYMVIVIILCIVEDRLRMEVTKQTST